MDEVNTREESALIREAFNFYYSLGEDRTYAKVAVKFKRSVSAVQKWGGSFKWSERITERDEKIRRNVAERAVIEKEVNHVERDIKILGRAILEHAKAIQEGKLKLSLGDMVKMMELEHKLRTGSDFTQHHTHNHELKGLSQTDVEKLIKEEIKGLAEYEIQKQKWSGDNTVDANFTELKESKDE